MMKRWMLNVAKGFTIFAKSLVGVTPPAPYVGRTYGTFATIERDAFNAALEHTHALMNTTGWNAGAYESGSMNCVTFCMKMLVEVVKEMEGNEDYDGRLPLSLFGYRRDSDGVGHCVLRVNIGGEPTFYEAMPEPRHLSPKTLSKQEVASRTFDFG
jgi:hypothetical protein